MVFKREAIFRLGGVRAARSIRQWIIRMLLFLAQERRELAVERTDFPSSGWEETMNLWKSRSRRAVFEKGMLSGEHGLEASRICGTAMWMLVCSF